MTGGIDLAAEWAGFTTVGQCEFADYPTKVLEKHWPNVPRWRDIKDVTKQSISDRGIGTVTTISAGIPCQEHSDINKYKTGNKFEWNETRRVSKLLQPNWLIIENVNGILGTIHDTICSNMEEDGYQVETYNIPAVSVGAPHKRYRVFIVGNFSSKSKSQNNKDISAIREERNAWQNPSRVNWGTLSGTYWGTYKPPVPGMDDGVAERFYKYRVKALGNMVVPQQIYPILKAIADIEYM